MDTAEIDFPALAAARFYFNCFAVPPLKQMHEAGADLQVIAAAINSALAEAGVPYGAMVVDAEHNRLELVTN